MKSKRTIDALKRPQPPSPDDNYVRTLKKTLQEARHSGSTSTNKRLKERRSGKKIPQLGEQENQSFPPLKVSSDIVENQPLLPGFTIGDYLPDDVEFETMEVDEFKYHYGKPLIKDTLALTTMMQRFHDWYMKTCSKFGKDALSMLVKEDHDFIGQELLTIDFDEFFQFYNQKALHKSLVACYCL